MAEKIKKCKNNLLFLFQQFTSRASVRYSRYVKCNPSLPCYSSRFTIKLHLVGGTAAAGIEDKSLHKSHYLDNKTTNGNETRLDMMIQIVKLVYIRSISGVDLKLYTGRVLTCSHAKFHTTRTTRSTWTVLSLPSAQVP